VGLERVLQRSERQVGCNVTVCFFFKSLTFSLVLLCTNLNNSVALSV